MAMNDRECGHEWYSNIEIILLQYPSKKEMVPFLPLKCKHSIITFILLYQTKNIPKYKSKLTQQKVLKYTPFFLEKYLFS